MNRAPSDPVGYIVYRRDTVKGARWSKVGESRDYGEAVSMMSAGGEWWISPVRDPALLKPETMQPSLFD